jgi:hypothetical protein
LSGRISSCQFFGLTMLFTCSSFALSPRVSRSRSRSKRDQNVRLLPV